ncbi:MAG: serine/threonine-protein kinase, partial [Terriglobales bacterium]
AEASPALPEWIGSYRVLGLLGEGGMGVVYRAEQSNPRRLVALKVVRPGAATPAMLRRFELEAQVLGRLQHPGIAQIHEFGVGDVFFSGVCAERKPFFAMELVDGPTLLEYARKKALSCRERLMLLARVCDAVQYAHQKGVIHRDLKPANILVAEQGSGFRVQGSAERTPDHSPLTTSATGGSADSDGGHRLPQPKVLDFGVARAAGGEFPTLTLATGDGQILGTLAYMSPEQVRGDGGQIDTRSDVYALGVILYELLAGRLPYDLSTKSLFEAARYICEVEPPRLRSIIYSLGREIDAISAKALQKDKTRRYQSAGDLGNDLRRYLAGDTVEARRDSAMYVLRKTLRRYRGAAAVVGVLLASM